MHLISDVEQLIHKNPRLARITEDGLVQQALHLLPLSPRIFVKLGADGVLYFQHSPQQDERTDLDIAKVVTRGRVGIKMQYFAPLPAPRILSVSGAGDAFAGTMVAAIAMGDTALTTNLVRTMHAAQHAAIEIMTNSRTVAT